MVKERVQAIVNTLPFKQYPNRLIVETVYNAIFWLNCFPHKNGIHLTLSPCTIITGSTIDYKNIVHGNLDHMYKYMNLMTICFCKNYRHNCPMAMHKSNIRNMTHQE